MPPSDDFYAELSTFSDFDAVTGFSDYSDFPDDWIIVASDVEGSTRAIEEGAYKSVNMVGAATITAVLNACGKAEIPFVFGGDGATLAIPPSQEKAVRNALLSLRHHAGEIFGLSLRIGLFSVGELRHRGGEISVRKFELSPGNYLAMFAGNGMAMCDDLLKDEKATGNHRLQVDPDNPPGKPDLEGLSCRWDPLFCKNGVILSVIVYAKAGKKAEQALVLGRVLTKIAAVIGDGVQAAAPANAASLNFRWPPQGLWLEARAIAGDKANWRSYLGVLISSLWQFISEKTAKKIGPYDPVAYRSELMANTDFRKFDGALRMTLDITADKADEIERYLDQQHAAGEIVHGCFRSKRAMMTCLVFSLEQSEHVHFIDAAGGGYAMAAKALKARS